LSDSVREEYLCVIFDVSHMDGKFREYVNDSIGDYWLIKYVLKDYPFLKSFTRRKTHYGLNLLYHLIKLENWYDATKMLQCFPDNFTAKGDRSSYPRFIQQAFEHGEMELAELMMNKATSTMVHYSQCKHELTKFDQWYGEQLMRSNHAKKKESKRRKPQEEIKQQADNSHQHSHIISDDEASETTHNWETNDWF